MPKCSILNKNKKIIIIIIIISLFLSANGRFNSYVDAVVRTIHQISYGDYSVKEVIKADFGNEGGSLGKGTATSDSDIDLVVYFNGLHSIEDLKRMRPKLIELIEKQIRGSCSTVAGEIAIHKVFLLCCLLAMASVQLGSGLKSAGTVSEVTMKSLSESDATLANGDTETGASYPTGK
nr:hypothetical protein BaRGS_014056 [Batillaria attramentaria]